MENSFSQLETVRKPSLFTLRSPNTIDYKLRRVLCAPIAASTASGPAVACEQSMHNDFEYPPRPQSTLFVRVLWTYFTTPQNVCPSLPSDPAYIGTRASPANGREGAKTTKLRPTLLTKRCFPTISPSRSTSNQHLSLKKARALSDGSY